MKAEIGEITISSQELISLLRYGAAKCSRIVKKEKNGIFSETTRIHVEDL